MEFLINARRYELHVLALVRWTGLSEKVYFVLETYIWPPYPPSTLSRNVLRHESDKKMKFDKFQPLALKMSIVQIAHSTYMEGFPKFGHNYNVHSTVYRSCVMAEFNTYVLLIVHYCIDQSRQVRLL